MSLTLLVAAPAFLVLGIALEAGARRALRAHRPLAIALLGLGGALCLALALLVGTIFVGLRGYRELTYEELAATVQTEPVARQHFRAIITLPDRRLAMYDFAGDAFYVDAHILKWHPLASALGLHTAYTLDRVAGRYNDVADERARPHTVYALARTGPVDLFFLARRRMLGPLVDAEYGSATFVPAGDGPATYELRVSTTGLLMRRAIP
jgi:hypothetical protein